MQILLTAAAEADLEAIGDYIATDNPNRALSFIAEIRAHCASLATAPFAFAQVPGFERAGLRKCSVGSYLIIYRTGAERITIIRILHGARDYLPLLHTDPGGGSL